ncbi:hypothetical protein [Psychrobium sp. 1_MG-2023]|nr:hypothetical protein [Psychrobium sp. 1_MG-2023]MDP2559732.1 hypothetical protein [Psychrobium sp. 1_MG-2023]
MAHKRREVKFPFTQEEAKGVFLSIGDARKRRNKEKLKGIKLNGKGNS